MSPATVPEPVTVMLARWWAARRTGHHDDAIIIIGLWRAGVIAEARRSTAGRP